MNNDIYFKPVSMGIKINVSSEQVWEVISKPGNLELCHPFCKTNPVEKWPGKESIDYVHYYNGLKYQRIFTNWIEGLGYDLHIGTVNGRKSKVKWRIDKTGESSSELRITIYPHDIKKYPNFVKPLIYFFYIKPMLRKYLNSVLKGFRTYIIQSKPIQKNQFGTHSWFTN